MRTLDLFAGAGGLSLGVELAGGSPVAAIEIDATAVETLCANFPTLQIAARDIRSAEAFRAIQALRKRVDVVVGGPPCQPFSVAGHQRAHDDPRNCIPDFIRAVQSVQPAAFVMENVGGLYLSRHRRYLSSVIGAFKALGFQVSAMVLDAASYGVPQHRRRLFLVGVRGDSPVRFPLPTHGVDSAHPFRSSGEAIRSAPKDNPNVAIVTFARNPILRPQPWDGMLVNGGGRPINLCEPCQTIPASAGGNRTHIVDPDGVLVEYHSYLMRGGKPRIGIVEGVRRLTVNESAAIQSFPKSYSFLGRPSARYRQVGNAVPPLLASTVMTAVFSHLNGTVADDLVYSELECSVA